jgi:spoIIIJ-associated protein
MVKVIEATAKTVEEAVRSALLQLGCSREDAAVEVLEKGKSGFLGIGAVPARVRVSFEEPDVLPEDTEPEEEPDAPDAPDEAGEPVPAPETPAADDDVVAKTEEFLKGLLEKMGSDAVPVLERKADGGILVNLTGEKLGMLIGHRGETLDAIQHIANYAMNRVSAEHVHISVDAENYRSKREESLKRLAEKVAGKVLKYRRSMTLEPMNSYERHVIHTVLQEVDGVSTYSIGSEPNRRIVVAYGNNAGPRRDRYRS